MTVEWTGPLCTAPTGRRAGPRRGAKQTWKSRRTQGLDTQGAESKVKGAGPRLPLLPYCVSPTHTPCPGGRGRLQPCGPAQVRAGGPTGGLQVSGRALRTRREKNQHSWRAGVPRPVRFRPQVANTRPTGQSCPPPCLYPVAAPSSRLTVKELHLYSPLKATSRPPHENESDTPVGCKGHPGTAMI